MLFYAIACLICFRRWANQHVDLRLALTTVTPCSAGAGAAEPTEPASAAVLSDDLARGRLTPNAYAFRAREAGVSSRTVAANLNRATGTHNRPAKSKENGRAEHLKHDLEA